MPFPASFPSAEAQVLLDYVMGVDVTPHPCRVVECAYDVLGYALSRACSYPHTPPAFFVGSHTRSLTKAQRADHLKALVAHAEKGDDGPQAHSAIPWPTIIQLLILILEEIFQQSFTPKTVE